MNNLTSLTSLDGRYQKSIEELQDIFSEYGLMKSRVYVEIQWFKFLASELKLFSLSADQLAQVAGVAGGKVDRLAIFLAAQ